MKLTKRKGFNFFRSYFDVYNELENDKDKVAFIDALLDRQFLGLKPTELNGMAKFAYISQTNSIDSQVKGYEDKTKTKLTHSDIENTTPCQPPYVGVKLPPAEQVEVKGEMKEEVNIYIYPTFEDFWELYDKKKSRTSTEPKWNKLSQKIKEEIMDYIPKYKNSVSNKQFIKHPSTFLNQKTWEDEIDDNSKSANKEFVPDIPYPTKDDEVFRYAVTVFKTKDEYWEHKEALRIQFVSWSVGGWKNYKGQPIINWKTEVCDKINFLRR